MTEQQPRDGFRPQDIITIPNAMSLTGAYLAWTGSEEMSTPIGLGKVIVGRSIDVADGAVARAINQESNVGATLDAGLDKVVMAKLLYELAAHRAAPRVILGTIATLNVINTATTTRYMTEHPGQSIRPTKTGKLAMAAESAALFAYAGSLVAAERSNDSKTVRRLRLLGHAAFIASLPMAFHATYSYLKRSRS